MREKVTALLLIAGNEFIGDDKTDLYYFFLFLFVALHSFAANLLLLLSESDSQSIRPVFATPAKRDEAG